MIALIDRNGELFYYCLYNGKEFYFNAELVIVDTILFKKSVNEVIYSACYDLVNNF
jgi:hypothetical protein